MDHHTDHRVLLLKQLASDGSDLLRPSTSLESFCGYWYPEAQAILKTNPGEEIEQLEHLAELGYLERQFFDRIHLCPVCSHFALNFRETCPQCETANINIVEMIHHFKCGAVAPETDFRDGIRLCCPKCSRLLRHIGVDYERPASNYLCAACQHIFSEPGVRCVSLTCGKVFDVDQATLHTLHVYRLSSKGAVAAARETIEEQGLSRAFIDADLAIYTYSFFEERLMQEITRSRRYERPLVIMLASPDHLTAHETVFGKDTTAARLKQVTEIIKETIRDCDIPAIYGDGTLAVLLQETSLEGAHIVIDRIRTRVYDLNPPEQEVKLTLSVGLAGLDGHEDARQMITAAREKLHEARKVGGNCVRPAKG